MGQQGLVLQTYGETNGETSQSHCNCSISIHLEEDDPSMAEPSLLAMLNAAKGARG